MSNAPIPFIDLKAQQLLIRDKVDLAISKVLDHGRYIMGPEVHEFEKQLAQFCGAKHAIACSNGTDALVLLMMARGVKPGDVVFCPSFTFAATAEVVALLGAIPYFIDVEEDTFNIDPESLKVAISEAKAAGMPLAGVVTVDLFGRPANYDEISPIAQENGIWLLCDSAQSFGATYKNQKIGTIGDMTSVSFFPAKPLGGYGDGGAVFVEDDEQAAIIRTLLNHGQGPATYDYLRIGINGRLDSIQAAVLLEKLAIFPDEIIARNRVAERYNAALGNLLVTPQISPDYQSVWAQYTLRTVGGDREKITASLKEKNIPTAIYYPKPIHQQKIYSQYPVSGGKLAVTDLLANQVFSLPMHPYLEADVQDRIIEGVFNSVQMAA